MVTRIDSHGYIQNEAPTYSFSIIDRGADSLVSAGQIDNDMATALKNEARRRADAGEFYGFINFVALIAARPLQPWAKVFGA